MSLETVTANADVLKHAFDLSLQPLAIAEFKVKQLVVKQANHAFAMLTTISASDIVGKDLLAMLEINDEIDDAGSLDDVRQTLVQHKKVDQTFWLNDKSGDKLHVDVGINPLPENNLFVVSLADTTDLTMAKKQVDESRARVESLRARLEQLSKIDTLTGVYNPKAINHELSILFNSAKRNYGSFSILFIEIDRLDEIEEEHGEKVQQKCIEHFAANLTRNFRRRSDIIIRYSMSQFLVCFAGANDAQTYNLADKILHAINNTPVIIEGAESKINLSISTGMLNVVLNLDSNLDHTIGEANIACEKAKRMGGNQIYVSEVD